MHTNPLVAMVDAIIGRGSNGNVVGFDTEVIQDFLNSDTDRGAPPPDADNKVGVETAFVNTDTQPK